MSKRGVISPVQTRYKGVTYRSRTEARWAFFFDQLDASHTYEPETFSIDGAWYLPDFFVTSWNLYFEVKGKEPTPYERERCRRLSEVTNRPVMCVAGAPGDYRGLMFMDSDVGHVEVPARFADCRRCDGWVIEYGDDDSVIRGVILLGAHGDWDLCGDRLTAGDEPQPATDFARNERFGVFEGRAH